MVSQGTYHGSDDVDDVCRRPVERVGESLFHFPPLIDYWTAQLRHPAYWDIYWPHRWVASLVCWWVLLPLLNSPSAQMLSI